MLLDMTPYCEDGSVKGDAIYELFSVVIHSGSTHSGHYTAYIRDVDDLGQWTHPVSGAYDYNNNTSLSYSIGGSTLPPRKL